MNANKTSVLRGIARELRKANPKLKPVSETSAFLFLINEYRIHQLTEKRTCKSPEELYSMGKTYLCYLQSLRKNQELLSQYYSKGERSVQETANLLGFRLPENEEI
ncbi:hypothetical protein X975_04457, partial [Stegodyphus mimosarum]